MTNPRYTRWSLLDVAGGKLTHETFGGAVLEIGDHWTTMHRHDGQTHHIPAVHVASIVTEPDSELPCGHVYTPTGPTTRNERAQYEKDPCIRPHGHRGSHEDANGEGWIER